MSIPSQPKRECLLPKNCYTCLVDRDSNLVTVRIFTDQSLTAKEVASIAIIMGNINF